MEQVAPPRIVRIRGVRSVSLPTFYIAAGDAWNLHLEATGVGFFARLVSPAERNATKMHRNKDQSAWALANSLFVESLASGKSPSEYTFADRVPI